MANRSHLNQILQGSESWNTWRSENPSIQPDLTDADLRGRFVDGINLQQALLNGANLSGIHAQGAEFYGARLDKASLTEAYLADAKFSESIFSDADFSHANLFASDIANATISNSKFENAVLHESNLARSKFIRCNFHEADIENSDLTDADLTRSNFQNARLGYVNFTRAKLDDSYVDGAIFGGTVFVDTNLQKVIGLDKSQHFGPSSIDLLTLARSGELPLSFMRGCGLPDGLIDYLPSLLNKPFQFYSCFISYSVKDSEFARRLHADLQNEGVRCWFAPEDMKIGDKIRERIDQSIRVYDKLLIILSRNSISSSWVEKEVETAFDEERSRNTIVLFPIRLDEDVLNTDRPWAADIRRTRHIGDFRDWKTHSSYQESFKRLLRDLRGAPSNELDQELFDDDDIPF